MGASINAHDNDGKTALCEASAQGHFETVSVLLQHGADVNVGNPLMDAIKNGSYQVTELLLNSRSIVNSISRRNTTALHIASSSGWLDIVKLLVQRGAKIDSYLDKTSPLHLACFNGHTDVANYLITSGADVNLPRIANKVASSLINVEGNSLSLAIHGCRIEVVHMLLECCTGANGQQKIDVNFISNDSTTPLMNAIQHGQREIAQMLLDHGADSNQVTINGVTPLIYAMASWCCDEMVPLLLQYNANLEYEAEGRLTPLSIAVIEKKPTMVKLLADRGARVNVSFEVEDKTCTPLIWAAYHNHADIVKELLAQRAIQTAKDSLGYTALMWTAAAGHKETAEVLVKANENDAALPSLSVIENTSTLIASNLSVLYGLEAEQEKNSNLMEAANNDGKTALLLAAEKGHSDIVSLLLLSGALVNVQDNDGCTPLQLAACGGHLEIVYKLLQTNADVNKRNKTGATPLWDAAYQGHPVIVNLLRDNNADVNICDVSGRSALCAALKKGHYGVVECLLNLQFPLYISWLTFIDGFLN